MAATTRIVEAGALTDVATQILVAGGFTEEDAAAMARHAVWSEASDIPNQGFWRLDQYIAKLRAGGYGTGEIIRTDCGPSLVRLDGADRTGQLVAETAAAVAAERAAETGLGLCVAGMSNHIGSAGYYTARLAGQGLIGVILSNGAPRNSGPATGRKLLGNNVLSVAVEATGGPVGVDMTVGSIAGSKLMMVTDQTGRMPEAVTDPRADNADARTATLTTAGGYKGFALGLAIEMLTGVLAGGRTLTGVASFLNAQATASGATQTVIAVDPSRLGPPEAVAEAAETLAQTLAEAGEHVPGRARAVEARRRMAEGIPIGPAQLDALAALAADTGVTLDAAFRR
ncbi:hypothetical protein HKCCE3408_06565 [Rhodobacterales bacterium HKCCE3408]|nr:hypothetical protein [Rhodobacterales bacterium HKCCE3408]